MTTVNSSSVRFLASTPARRASGRNTRRSNTHDVRTRPGSHGPWRTPPISVAVTRAHYQSTMKILSRIQPPEKNNHRGFPAPQVRALTPLHTAQKDLSRVCTETCSVYGRYVSRARLTFADLPGNRHARSVDLSLDRADIQVGGYVRALFERTHLHAAGLHPTAAGLLKDRHAP